MYKQPISPRCDLGRLSEGRVSGILRSDMAEGATSRPRALAAGLALAALGALGLGGAARDEVKVTLKDKVIKDLSSKGLTLAFHLDLANPAEAPRELVRYRYRVTINQKPFLNMTVALDAPLAVPPGGETLVALPVKISYDLLAAAVGPIEEKAVCDLVGDLYFLTERKKEQRVPVAFSGEFPVFKDPEVGWLPLKVNDLTVGGADVVFQPVFRNLNPYDLLVDRIRFRLFFGEDEALAGDIPGDKTLPRAGEKAFALPFLLDFFESGERLRESFQKDELPCRFEGEVEIASVWGRLLVRFDERRALRLERSPQ